MASAGKSSGGSKPAGSRARSVGAAGGGKPNGAILDDTREIQTEQRKRFNAWKEGYRKKSLTEKKKPLLDYSMKLGR
jgi:hypothetical protein